MDRGKQTLNKFTVRQLFCHQRYFFSTQTAFTHYVPQNSALLGKITFALTVKKFPAFLGTPRGYYFIPKIMPFTPGVDRIKPNPFPLRSIV